MFLDEFEGPRRVRLDILPDLLDSLAVLLFVNDVALLLERHLVLQLHRYLALRLESLPGLAVLSLPVLSRHSSLYSKSVNVERLGLLRSFLSTFLR